jgi:AbrB family looped-hinge helix DNA binding protein
MRKKTLPITQVRRKVAKDGSILIPSDFRKALGIKPGQTLYAHMEDGELVLSVRKPRKKNP